MIDQTTLEKLGINKEQGRILEYVIRRAADEFKFPITLEFIQTRSKREIYIDVRAWIASALRICGKGDWNRRQVCAVINLDCHKSLSAALSRGHRKWSSAYWRGFDLRWRCDAIDLFEYA